jgi:VIT1/CCC1 family predicted Fe2+/Mn2+ transporter
MKADFSIMTISFDNSYARLPERFYARLPATPVAAPRLLKLNTALAEELGLDPDALGSPIKVAVSSFIAFAVGACVVVLPYLFFLGAGASTTIPLGLAIVMSLMAMTAVGAVVGRTSGRGVVKGAVRQLAVGVGAALVTYLIGRVVGAVTGLNGLG